MFDPKFYPNFQAFLIISNSLLFGQAVGECLVLPNIRTPANGYILTIPTQIRDGQYATGANYQFACNPTYSLVGNPIVSCQPDGNWSPTQMYCQSGNGQPPAPAPTLAPFPVITMAPSPPAQILPGLACQSPFIPSNTLMLAQSQGGEYPVGTVLTIQCVPGYAPNLASIICRPDGTWSFPFLICMRLTTTTTRPPVTCRTPPAPPGATLATPPVTDIYQIGQQVLLACQPNFDQFGTGTSVTCRGDGTWSPATFTCQPKRATCTPPNLSPTLRISFGQKISYTEGDVLTLGCPDGFQNGTDTMRCQSNGQWTVPTLNCQRTCLRPDLPRFATEQPLAEQYLPGQMVEYRCQPGYTIWGTVRCQNDGTWSSAAMTCQVANRGIVPQGGSPITSATGTCRTPRTPNNAQQVGSTSQQFNAGDFIAYSCTSGYTVSGILTCLSDGTWSGAVYTCRL